MAPLVRSLQAQGIRLDQMRFIHNRQPISLTLVFDHTHGAAYSLWNNTLDPEPIGKARFYNIHGVIKPLSVVITDILKKWVST